MVTTSETFSKDVYFVVNTATAGFLAFSSLTSALIKMGGKYSTLGSPD